MTNEEKAKELLGAPIQLQWTFNYWLEGFSEATQKELREKRNLLIKMAEWKDQQYQSLLKTCKDLISILQTSRAYHLGITALDSHEEIGRKEREGNTALIRSIDREINYANVIINELLEEQ